MKDLQDNRLTLQIDLIQARNQIKVLTSQVSELMYSCANAYENEKAKNALLSKAFTKLLGDFENAGFSVDGYSVDAIRAAVDTFEEGDKKQAMKNYLNNQ